jgi:hypothetical protein
MEDTMTTRPQVGDRFERLGMGVVVELLEALARDKWKARVVAQGDSMFSVGNVEICGGFEDHTYWRHLPTSPSEPGKLEVQVGQVWETKVGRKGVVTLIGRPSFPDCWDLVSPAPAPATAPPVAERPRGPVKCYSCGTPDGVLRRAEKGAFINSCAPCYLKAEKGLGLATALVKAPPPDRSWLETTRHVPESLCGSLRWVRR